MSQNLVVNFMPKFSTFFVIVHDITMIWLAIALSSTHAHNNELVGGARSIHFRIAGWSVRSMVRAVTCNMQAVLATVCNSYIPGMDGIELIVGCVALLFLSFSTVCCKGKFAWQLQLQ